MTANDLSYFTQTLTTLELGIGEIDPTAAKYLAEALSVNQVRLTLSWNAKEVFRPKCADTEYS